MGVPKSSLTKAYGKIKPGNMQVLTTKCGGFMFFSKVYCFNVPIREKKCENHGKSRHTFLCVSDILLVNSQCALNVWKPNHKAKHFEHWTRDPGDFEGSYDFMVIFSRPLILSESFQGTWATESSPKQ